MNVNLISNATKINLNQCKKVEAIVTNVKYYGPYIDAADGALLRDKKVSDAIKASVLPIVNRAVYNINEWKVNLKQEFNKPENKEIKEDYEQIKKKIDYSKMYSYSEDKLKKVIENLKNRKNWINFLSNYQDENLKNILLKKIKDKNNKSILTCFGVNRKNNLPVFNKDVFDITVRTLTKNDLSSFMNNYNEIFECNETYNQLIKNIAAKSTSIDCENYEEDEDDEDYKGIVTSFNSWQPELDKLKKSENIKDIRILKLIIDNFNNSLKDLKFVMPVFNEDVFNEVKKNIMFLQFKLKNF